MKFCWQIKKLGDISQLKCFIKMEDKSYEQARVIKECEESLFLYWLE